MLPGSGLATGLGAPFVSRICCSFRGALLHGPSGFRAWCVCVFFGLEFRAPIVRTPGRFVPWPYTKLPALVETLSGRIRIWGLGFGVYRGLGVQGLRV